jgi:hypothetical protein
MNDNFDRKLLGYSSLPPSEQDALRRAVEQRARRLKKRAAADFFKRLARRVRAVTRISSYRNERGRTSATSTCSP